MKRKIVLVTGGARSGKSVFAEKYAAGTGMNVAYIATAQVLDEEMRLRVNLHRQRRPEGWTTFEAPLGAEKVIREASEQYQVILFDCLTVYTSNLLLAESAAEPESRFSNIMKQVEQLVAAVLNSCATVIFVTNEVGMGIVPDNPLAREYRDLAGLVNQKLAAIADEVYLVVSGLAVDMKKLAVSGAIE